MMGVIMTGWADGNRYDIEFDRLKYLKYVLFVSIISHSSVDEHTVVSIITRIDR